jgi:hypothetical protein
MISLPRFIKIDRNPFVCISYQNKNILTKLKMNLDDSLNKSAIEEKEFQKNYVVPGKIKIGENEIIQREKKLKSLAENWKKERIIEEESSNKLFGFTKNSEVLNGRLAMFFLTTGILTEIWTNQTMIGQIDTTLRITGLL